MKRILPIVTIFTIILSTLSIFAPQGKSETILMLNSDFELQLNYWSTSTGNATYTADSSDPHGGSYCAKGVELNEGSLGRLYQDVTGLVGAGGEYKISGWVKTSSVVGFVVIGLNYVANDGSTPADGYVKEIGYVSGTTNWAYFESEVFILPPMPTDATAIWFLFDFNAGKGTAWWDDVSLIEVTPPAPVGGFWTPISKFDLLAPWIGLASLIVVATISIVCGKCRKKKCARMVRL